MHLPGFFDGVSTPAEFGNFRGEFDSNTRSFFLVIGVWASDFLTFSKDVSDLTEFQFPAFVLSSAAMSG